MAVNLGGTIFTGHSLLVVIALVLAVPAVLELAGWTVIGALNYCVLQWFTLRIVRAMETNGADFAESMTLGFRVVGGVVPFFGWFGAERYFRRRGAIVLWESPGWRRAYDSRLMGAR